MNFNLIKQYRKRNLKKLQSISRSLGYVLPFIKDKDKQVIGYRNLFKIERKIRKLYNKVYREDRRQLYD